MPNINFPANHPKIDNTYICHPYDSNTYLSLDSYENDLFADRIDEFCYLLQCLGATSIVIEKTNTKSESENKTSNNSQGGEAGVPLYGKSFDASFNRNNSSKSEKLNKIASKFGREQFFNPSTKPFIPQNLIWFKHEKNWQRLSDQRLNGNLLEHREIISNTQNQILGGNEINEIKGELNALSNLFKLKGHKFDQNTNEIKINEEEELKILVKFKPLEEFDNTYSNTITALSDERISDTIINEKESPLNNEQEYIEEVRFCIEDDNEIDDKERRVLERFRIKLGISEDRAKELENQVINSSSLNLNENEKEYLDEVKSFVEDGSTISDKERRILNRLANLLGISEDRAKEIEQSI